MGVSNPLIENFLVGPLQMRCSVVTDVDTGDTVIIDGVMNHSDSSIGSNLAVEQDLIGQRIQKMRPK